MSNEPKAGKAIDPEMLAAYIDNRLPPEQRAAVEAQLATDPKSYALLVDTLEALDDDEIKALEVKEPSKQPIPFAPKPKSTFRTLKVAGGVLAVAAAIVLVVWTQPDVLRRLRGWPAADPSMAKLVEAVGEQRYFEPRLSVSFKYGPLRSGNRKPQDLSSSNLALIAAAGELQKAAVERPDVDTLHAWGVAQALLGDYDGSIRTLSDARTRARADASLEVDLAAALLARGASGDAAEAFDHLARATVDETLAEAVAFNRALALEGMGLSRRALEEWQSFLDSYPSSPWRHDAMTHLQTKPQSRQDCAAVTVSSLPATTFPRGCGAQAVQAFQLVHLKRWTEAVTGGDRAQVDSALATLRSLANAISLQTGDTFTMDVVSGLKNDRRLATSIRQFIEAVEQMDSDRLVGAERSLNSAMPVLLASKHPLAIEAELHLATVEAQARRLTVAVERLDRARGAIGQHSYLSLTARELWLRGVVALRDFQPALALEHYRTAFALYEQIGFVDPGAAVKNAQADTERLLGLTAQGLGTLQDAMAMLPGMSHAIRRYLIYFNAALYSEVRGLLHSSLAYQDEAIVEANAGDTVMAGIEALVYRARYRAAVRNVVPAIDDLAQAEQMLPHVQAENLRTYLGSRIKLARFDIDAGDGTSDDTEVRRAIDFFSGSEPAEVPRLWGTLAKKLQSRGDVDAALRAIESGIAAFEDSRSRLKHPEFQSSSLDAAWDLYGQGVDLSMQRGDPQRALWFAQRPAELNSRGRLGVFRAQPISKKTGTLIWAEVGARVYWWFLRDGLYRSSGALSVTSGQVAAMVADASRSNQLANSSVPPAALVAISDLLISAIDVSDLERLIVVPDGVLTALPFPALWDSRSRRFLIETMDVVVGVRTNTNAGLGSGRNRALIIANRGDDAGLDWLRPLTFSKLEAEAIAASYDAPLLMWSDDASRQEIFTAYRAADIIHFAGHAVANSAVPAMSALVLGGVPARFLYAYELAQLPESSGKTIVLAACETAAGRSVGGLGADSLARPFLSAGAAAVIATSQPIDDRYAARFFVEFHDRLSKGRDAVAALRETQLAAIARQEPVANWSAIVSSTSVPMFQPSEKES